MWNLLKGAYGLKDAPLMWIMELFAWLGEQVKMIVRKRLGADQHPISGTPPRAARTSCSEADRRPERQARKTRAMRISSSGECPHHSIGRRLA